MSRRRVLLWLVVLTWALPASAGKPNPPEPPSPPAPELPGPPTPGRVAPSTGEVRAASAPEPGEGARVEFVQGARTPVVSPGAVLIGMVRVRSEQPREVWVRWKVDGEAIGESRGTVAGERVFTSPKLPTERPGVYLFDPEVSGVHPPAVAYAVLGQQEPEYASGELAALVAGTEDTVRKVAEEAGVLVVRVVPAQGLQLVTLRVPGGLSVDEALGRLRGRPEVTAADKVALYGVRTGSLQDLQYAPALMGVPSAHRYATGRGVRVVLVDTGVDTQHPELRGKVVVEENVASSPYAAEAHGTAVAGVLVASRRLQGVATGAQVRVVRACTAVRPGALMARCRTDDLARAFLAALRAGAGVVNVSLGGPPDALVEAVVRQMTRQVLVVAAAGNGSVGYPSEIPGVMAVGATDRRDVRYPHSPVGGFISVSAPGVDVLTTLPGGRYAFLSGTSISAAHVSGTVALLVEAAGAFGPEEVRRAVERTAQDLGPPGRDPEYGWGRVSACRSVAAVLPTARCP